MFNAMMDAIKEESVGFLFHVDVQVETEEPEPEVVPAGAEVPSVEALDAEAEPEPATQAPRIKAKGLAARQQPQRLAYSAPSVDGEGGVTQLDESEADIFAGATRNQPCPCGSGRKFKRCHGDPAARAARASA